jgi:adenine-specific DNA-methyltransferase
MTADELDEPRSVAPNVRIFQSAGIESENPRFSFFYEGVAYSQRWKTNEIGLRRLALGYRLFPVNERLRYVRYFDDFPYIAITNSWEDTGTGSFTDPKVYVVQTGVKVIERCLLMTTDPGDLVFDPTCGSGTTAYVAEQWGRRWITCDTSRVAITLARQRLMTAVFDYYELAYPHPSPLPGGEGDGNDERALPEGEGGGNDERAHPNLNPLPLGEGGRRPGEGMQGVWNGFRYKTVPHVTLKSIANNPEIDGIYARLHPAVEQALADLNAALKLPSPPGRGGGGGRRG